MTPLPPNAAAESYPASPTKTVAEIPFHPLANIFPLVEGAELRELVEDVRQHGLREPVILHEGMILDGRNRYRACNAAQADCRFSMFDGADALASVISANLRRRHLSEAQRAAVAGKIANLRPGYNQHTAAFGGANLPDLPPAAPAITVAQAAEMLNVSERSVKSAKAVIDHGTPPFLAAVETGAVSVSAAADVARLPETEQKEIVAKGEKEILEAAKRIRGERGEACRAERFQKIAEMAAPAPDLALSQRFSVILADPPWRYEHAESVSREIENQYPTMEHEAMKALAVEQIATPDAVLFLWVTSPMLATGMEVLTAWGFTYRTCMVWVKDRIGMGYWARQQHELMLIGSRGDMPAPAPANRPASVISAPRGEHSEKPVEFHEVIERAFPALPKVELFARRARDGWSLWGNEAPEAAA